MSAPSTTQREVNITRTFDAPRSLVFEAWTDAKHLAQWWGPHHFTNPRCEIDARPGGAIHIDMRAPDGNIYPSRGVVREIVKPERLVMTFYVLDNKGGTIFEVLNTVTFEEAAGRTKLAVNARVVNAQPEAEQYIAGMQEGWSQSMERLTTFLEGERP